MSKEIRETTAFKSIRAIVILDKKGEIAGKVFAHYANSGGVTVEIHQFGDERAERTAKAMGYILDTEGRIESFNGKATRHKGEWPYVVANSQRGHASGYGYDKYTAALSGMVFDGHKLTNHCGDGLARPKGRLWHDSDRKRIEKKGYRFANWRGPVEPLEGTGNGTYNSPKGVKNSDSGWQDCYRMEGISYLSAIGYRVIEVI